MSDSDDDLGILPRPAAKAAIQLDDSDDELLPAPTAAAPPKPPVQLDDSDDDLLPAPASPKPAATAAAPVTAVAAAHTFSSPKAAAPAAKPTLGSSSPRSAAKEPSSPKHTDPVPDELSETLRKTKTFRRKDLHLEGYLFKQQPNWPYGRQRRWCVLNNRVFNYYEDQNSVKPNGTIDLKGAKVLIDPPEARNPNSFGITNVTTSGYGGGATGQSRIFLFSCIKKEDVKMWVDAVKTVTIEPQSEVHWFEKLAQGLF